MNKSFKARLAELERLEAQSAATSLEAGQALTSDDCKMLHFQIEIGNVVIDSAGRLARSFRLDSAEYTAQLDIALARCNAASPPRDMAALKEWLEKQFVWTVEDADDLGDDEVLSEAGWALGEGRLMTCWDTGIFRITFGNAAWHPAYWQRVAERAQVIADQRGIIIFPMTPDEISEAIALVESGRLTVKPRHHNHQYSHSSCIHAPWPAEGWTETYHKGEHLARALDCALWQHRRRTGELGVLCESAEAVLEALRGVNEEL